MFCSQHVNYNKYCQPQAQQKAGVNHMKKVGRYPPSKQINNSELLTKQIVLKNCPSYSTATRLVGCGDHQVVRADPTKNASVCNTQQCKEDC